MLQIHEGLDMSRVMPLSDWAAREWKTADSRMIVRRSKTVLSIVRNEELILVVGVYAPTITSIPEAWILLCNGFSRELRHNARFIKEHFGELLAEYPRLRAKVEIDYLAGNRFVKFLGFKEVQNLWLSDGKEYIVYEVTA